MKKLHSSLSMETANNRNSRMHGGGCCWAMEAPGCCWAMEARF
jgi:hypothetical protein